MIVGRAAAPSRPELGWMCFADIVGILLAIFGGIFTMLMYGRSRECGTDDCDALRSNAASPYEATAAYLLYAVAYVLLPDRCVCRR